MNWKGAYRDRAASAAGVALFHLLLGYALLTGLGVSLPVADEQRLNLFDVALPVPPPPVEEAVPEQRRQAREEGAAAPPNLVAKAAPVAAPPPRVKLKVPPPVVAAPLPGVGAAPSAGASTLPGPGSGSGGQGVGTGSGGSGNGPGGGGAAQRAQHVSGRISDSDYPKTASRARIGGTVIVRFTVGTDGRVSGCRVSRSSGNLDLDATTCRLVERRFRYRPALDSSGAKVADVMGWKQVWWLESRGGKAVAAPAGTESGGPGATPLN